MTRISDEAKRVDWRWYVGEGDKGIGLIVEDGEAYLYGGIIDGIDHDGDIKIKLNSKLLLGLSHVASKLSEMTEEEK